MSRAEDLFIRLRDKGCDALETMIAERELESLFLDFKRSPANGVSKNLVSEDNKNLSKAVSGFSNSSGGIVVWGVDCRRDSATGNEIAQKYPLDDAGGFATKIQNAISRATVPPHPTAQVIFFDEPGSSPKGYVVVLIPRSVIGPLRSVVSNHYHFRSGSDFGIVPHDVLAGMFGRAPQPEVDLKIVSRPARLESVSEHLTLDVGLSVINLGAVIAERPYVSVAYGNIPANQIKAICPDSKSFSMRQGLLPVFSVVGFPGLILPPGSSEDVCRIIIYLPLGEPKSLQLDCSLGAIGTPPKRFLLSASEASVADAIKRLTQAPLQSMDVLQLLPQS